ncbi:MAG: hypothetical protein OSB09_06785 [Planctomycetota bacterium]|nr:hypothetical protein [Planctomycetota bacterium]
MVDIQPPDTDVGDLIGLPGDGDSHRKKKSHRKRRGDVFQQAKYEPSNISLLLIHNERPEDDADLNKLIKTQTISTRHVDLLTSDSLRDAQACFPIDGYVFKFVVVSCGDEPEPAEAYKSYSDRIIWILNPDQPTPDFGLRLNRPIEGADNNSVHDKIFGEEAASEIASDGISSDEATESMPEEYPRGGHEDPPIESRDPMNKIRADVSDEELEILTHSNPVEYAPVDLQPDGLAAMKVLLKARMDGVLLVDALRQWVVGDPAFLGWAELSSSEDEVELKVGGRDRGAVLRSIGDQLDGSQPLPTGVGQFGPLIGLPHDQSWLGFLARDEDAGRRELFKVLQLLPLLERLIPDQESNESSSVEDPENRFSRLLTTRLRAVERGGPAPGVLLLEHIGEPHRLIEKDLLRGTDWIESSEAGLWVLLDHPSLGAAEALTLRLEKALPGIRGGGVIGVPAGEVARECMERCKDLLRNSDHLRIVDQMR